MINEIGDEGASALAAVLKETKITELKCAAAQESSLPCQRLLTRLHLLIAAHTPHVPLQSLLQRHQRPRRFRARPCPQGDAYYQARVRRRRLPEHIYLIRSQTSFLRCSRMHTHPCATHDAALHRAPRGPWPRHPAFGRGGRACQSAPILDGHLGHPCNFPITACGTTTSTTKPNRPSKTPPAAALRSSSSKRPWCASPDLAASP